ncbi:MAG: AzlD domain-containing protein [Lachnospiraceae bacterium]|nr:AzlD domain-containing protein [Lachnospiraceae bacterium]
MKHPVYLYIAFMAVTTYLIRVLPLTLIRKEITNKTLRSFLFYVPYVTLAVMTFPSILEATQSPISGLAALLTALALAWFGRSLFQVSVLSCVVVFLLELVLV